MLGWLVTQVTSDGGFDIGQALISYGVAAPMIAFLVWLIRTSQKRYDDDVQAHREQLDLERKANRELYDRIIAQQERMAPVLEMAARALDHATGSQR